MRGYGSAVRRSKWFQTNEAINMTDLMDSIAYSKEDLLSLHIRLISSNCLLFPSTEIGIANNAGYRNNCNHQIDQPGATFLLEDNSADSVKPKCKFVI